MRISQKVAACSVDVITEHHVASIDELPASRVVLCDVTPRQLLAIAGYRLPASNRRKLGRHRYGLGGFERHWALNGLIPWRVAKCARAATVRLGRGWRKSRNWSPQLGKGDTPTGRSCC